MRYTGIGLDLDLELCVKPVIQELVRTQVCFPNLKLLVDKIAVVTLPDVDELSGNEAYKLTLTDGEKTIQALLKRRIYKTIYSEDVREGSFVILKIYHLAQAEKVNGKGTVTYIVIEDFYSIGEDDRYGQDLAPIRENSPTAVDCDDLEKEKQRLELTKVGISTSDGKNLSKAEALADPVSQDSLEAEDVETQDENTIDGQSQKIASPTPPSSQQIREAMKRKWDTALDEIDTNDTYRLSKYRKLEEARAREAKEAADASARALLIRYQSLPTTPLVSLTGPNKRRNAHHDVLALIVSVSPDLIKRSGMPPKRDLRIMDISTIKKVSLSVFVSAEAFLPEPGTVALFKHLTTHDSNGSSLNAYSKDCDGKDWFIPDPPGFENGEVAQLKDCWARIQFSEQVAREQADSLSQINGPLDIPEEEDIADHLPPVSGKKHLTCFYWAKNGTCRYTDDECAYAHYNTGIVAHDPMHNQSISIDTNIKDKSTQNSGLPPSRSLTCFFWARNRKCNRSDEECSYAHYDTGTIAKAPPGVTIFEPAEDAPVPLTKTLTCYFWNKNGRCNRSDAECAYAHYDTGTVAYPPPTVATSFSTNTTTHNNSNNNDSPPSEARPRTAPQPPTSSSSAPASKSLTCFFWARNGHCIRSDTECSYAHYDTGVVANNPNPALYPELNQSTLPIPQSNTTMASTSISTPAPTMAAATASEDGGGGSSSFPSVKHLTCYFWANFGRCKRSDQECNYAHFHTGRMAVNPAELRRQRRG
ncbi:MAG: hypothetical protein Q9225_007147 [Loekoesia sp. 1 TL-2023]